jgi:hypothetical protein
MIHLCSLDKNMGFRVDVDVGANYKTPALAINQIPAVHPVE